MKKMDFGQSYGVVYGSDSGVKYEQDGLYFDGAGDQIVPPLEIVPTVTDSMVIPTDSLESAKAFLKQILKGGPVPKPRIYKEAEGNNQNWADVTTAAQELGLMKYKFKDIEQWKLTEV